MPVLVITRLLTATTTRWHTRGGENAHLWPFSNVNTYKWIFDALVALFLPIPPHYCRLTELFLLRFAADDDAAEAGRYLPA